MSIVSSNAIEGTPLPDGSRLVTETHVDSVGGEHVLSWFGTDAADSHLAANAAMLEAQLAEAEAAALLGSG